MPVSNKVFPRLTSRLKINWRKTSAIQTLSTPYYFVLIILVLFPVIFIAGNSIMQTNPLNGLHYLTLDNYIRFFTEENHIALNALIRSLYFALIATTICIVLGYPFAYFLSKLKTNKRELLMLLISAPMWINMTLRIIGWKPILEFPDGYITKLLYALGFGEVNLIANGVALIIGLVYIYLPFMIIPIYTSLIKIDKSHLEASQDLGASPVDTFVHVVLPLSLPGVLSGITMVFLPTATAILVPHYLYNPVGANAGQLIGQIIETRFVKEGNYGFGSAISLVLALIITIMVVTTKKVDKYTEITEKERDR